MKYEVILDQVLQEARSGRDPERAIAAHPRHAARLRTDVELALAVNETRPAVPMRQGAPERMQAGMLTELARARAASAASRRPPWSILGGRTWAFSGALGLAAVVAIAALVASGVLFGGASTAEAAFDGVVIGNDGATLTVQTSDRIETVKPSSSADTASLAVGSFVSVRGQRLKNGTVALKAVAQAALTDWCDGHADQCLQLRTSLQKQLQACERNKQACVALAARLEELEQNLGSHTRQLIDLEGRCQEGNAEACQRLKTFCVSRSSLCGHLRSAEGVGKPLLTRLQNLRTSCANDGSRCAQLKVFCSQNPQVCSGVQKDLQNLQDSLKNRRPAN